MDKQRRTMTTTVGYYTKRGYKASQGKNRSLTSTHFLHSYTTLVGTPLFISPISTPVPPGGPHGPLLPIGLTSVADVCLRGRKCRLKASFNDPIRLSVSLMSWPSSPPPSPALGSGSEVLPRSFLVKSPRWSLKAWTLSKALKSVLASTIVPTHHKTKRTIIARTMPTRSFVHVSLLSNSASRPKAAVKAIVLSINDIRPTNHKTVSDFSELTTRAVTNTVNYIGSQGFQAQEYCYDDLGYMRPITATSVAVSKGIGVRNQTIWLTTSSASFPGLVLCCHSSSRPITVLPRDVMMER